MNLSLADVSKGWKVYVLIWGWLGVLLGLVSESAVVALVMWAIGASAGWVLAPRVHDFGWRDAGARVARYIVAPLVACAVPLLLIAGMNGPTNNRSLLLGGATLAAISAWMLWNRRWLERRWLTLPAAVAIVGRMLTSTDIAEQVSGRIVLLAMTAVGLAVVAIYAVNPNLLTRRLDIFSRRKKSRSREYRHDDTRYRCPQCGAPTALRIAKGSLRCETCGRISECS